MPQLLAHVTRVESDASSYSGAAGVRLCKRIPLYETAMRLRAAYQHHVTLHDTRHNAVLLQAILHALTT
jgi:hypothetical protein